MTNRDKPRAGSLAEALNRYTNIRSVDPIDFDAAYCERRDGHTLRDNDTWIHYVVERDDRGTAIWRRRYV